MTAAFPPGMSRRARRSPEARRWESEAFGEVARRRRRAWKVRAGWTVGYLLFLAALATPFAADAMMVHGAVAWLLALAAIRGVVPGADHGGWIVGQAAWVFSLGLHSFVVLLAPWLARRRGLRWVPSVSAVNVLAFGWVAGFWWPPAEAWATAREFPAYYLWVAASLVMAGLALSATRRHRR